MDHHGRLAVVDRLGQVLDDGLSGRVVHGKEKDDQVVIIGKTLLGPVLGIGRSGERDGQRRVLLNGLGEDWLEALVVVKASAGTPQDLDRLGVFGRARCYGKDGEQRR